MTIEEKRIKLKEFCNSMHSCAACPVYEKCCIYADYDWGNLNAPNSQKEIETTYDAFFGTEEEEKTAKLKRTEILEKAIETTNGSRSQDYGKPEKSFDAMAVLWTGYLRAKYGAEFELTPKDVALMMVEFKIGRTITGHNKEDNYVDMCGYAANAGEIEHEENMQ